MGIIRNVIALTTLLCCIGCRPAADGERHPVGDEWGFVGAAAAFFIVEDERDGLIYPNCSGVFIEHGIFVTAKHCIYTVQMGYPLILAPNDGLLETEPGNVVVRPHQVNEVLIDPENDFAMIKYDPDVTITHVDIPPIRVAHAAPEDGEPMLFLGYPVLHDETAVRLLLADGCEYDKSLKNEKDRHDRGTMHKTTCAGSYNASGGPFFTEDPDGTLVFHGVASGLFVGDGLKLREQTGEDEFGEHSRIGFASVHESFLFDDLRAD